MDTFAAFGNERVPLPLIMMRDSVLIGASQDTPPIILRDRHGLLLLSGKIELKLTSLAQLDKPLPEKIRETGARPFRKREDACARNPSRYVRRSRQRQARQDLSGYSKQII